MSLAERPHEQVATAAGCGSPYTSAPERQQRRATDFFLGSGVCTVEYLGPSRLPSADGSNADRFIIIQWGILLNCCLVNLLYKLKRLVFPASSPPSTSHRWHRHCSGVNSIPVMRPALLSNSTAAGKGNSTSHTQATENSCFYIHMTHKGTHTGECSGRRVLIEGIYAGRRSGD